MDYDESIQVTEQSPKQPRRARFRYLRDICTLLVGIALGLLFGVFALGDKANHALQANLATCQSLLKEAQDTQLDLLKDHNATGGAKKTTVTSQSTVYQVETEKTTEQETDSNNGGQVSDQTQKITDSRHQEDQSGTDSSASEIFRFPGTPGYPGTQGGSSGTDVSQGRKSKSLSADNQKTAKSGKQNQQIDFDQKKAFLRKDGKLQALTPQQKEFQTAKINSAEGLSVTELPQSPPKSPDTTSNIPGSSLAKEFGQGVGEGLAKGAIEGLKEGGKTSSPGTSADGSSVVGIPKTEGKPLQRAPNVSDKPTGKATQGPLPGEVSTSGEERTLASGEDVNEVLDALVEQCVKDQAGTLKQKETSGLSPEQYEKQRQLTQRMCKNRYSKSLGL